MAICPTCGSPEPSDQTLRSDKPRAVVARVESVAEAGYLASLLQEANLSAATKPVETFDAARGVWAALHTVSVPKDQAPAAARILTAEADGGFSEVIERLYANSDGPGSQAAVNPWLMLTVLAVVAAAGSALMVDRVGAGPKRARGAAPPQRPQGETMAELIAAIREDPAPLITLANGEGPRRQLQYSAAAGALVLSIDDDGDGRYESQRRFTAPAIGR